MRLAMILGFLTLVCGLVYFVFSHPSLERLETLDQELSQLQAQNQALADRNQELERQILALRDDPRLAERRARESIGMARPEELIFQFDEPREQSTVQVRLEVGAETMELAGRPVTLEELDGRLAVLSQQLPRARLRLTVDDEVGPIERQRVIDIVADSPMAPDKEQDAIQDER